MRKVFVPALIVAALALVLSACDAQFNPSAARVAGDSIAVSSLNAAMAAQANNPGYACEHRVAKQTIVGVGGKGTYATSFAASTLAQLIQAKASALVDRRLGLHPGSFAASLARDQLVSGFDQQRSTTCPKSGAQVVAAFAPAYRALLLGLVADEDLISAHAMGVDLTPAGLSRYGVQHPEAVSLNCVSDIIVKTQAKANALLASLRSGGNFASLARANSLDPNASSGGTAGCAYASQFVHPIDQTVAHLAVGQVTAPIAFSGDYLLLEVTSRRRAGNEQVANLIDSQPAAVAGLRSETQRVVVSVDSAYGHWSSLTGTVVSPGGPASALVPNLQAVTPGASPAG